MHVKDASIGSNRALQYLHEYLFSLNLAWALVWVARTTHKTPGGSAISDFLSGAERGFSVLVSPIGGHTVLDQLILSFAISVAGFCLLRALSGFMLTNLALRTAAGTLAIIAFPVAAYSSSLGPNTGALQIVENPAVLTLETVFILVCGVLFFQRNSLISLPRLAALLLFHFVLWAWLTSSYINVFSFVIYMRGSDYYHPWGRTLGSLAAAIMFKFGFPLLGFLASLSWVIYVDSSFRAGRQGAYSGLRVSRAGPA